MTNREVDFETWYNNLVTMILDKSGVDFRDEESVRTDYDTGKDCADIANEIASEYKGWNN